MAAADQIKSLIQSFADSDDRRFFSIATQIAASEAKKGHTNFAQELKTLIQKAKEERNNLSVNQESKTIPLSSAKRELQELIEIYQPKIKLKDMVLNKDVSQSLNRVITEQKKFDLLSRYDLSPKRKLLLTGPPGCGKTMTAQAIAGELNIPVFIVRLDGLISKYMGESIAKLRLIFDSMQESRAVYLFDEFDSIGSHRNQGHDVGEIKRVLNSFLINIEKDNSNSLIVAATNMPETLDKALFRRFDEIIEYPLPTKTEIKSVYKKYLNKLPVDNDLDYEAISKKAQGLNYSDIVRTCEEAIKDMVINERESISLNSLLSAIKKRSNG